MIVADKRDDDDDDHHRTSRRCDVVNYSHDLHIYDEHISWTLKCWRTFHLHNEHENEEFQKIIRREREVKVSSDI